MPKLSYTMEHLKKMDQPVGWSSELPTLVHHCYVSIPEIAEVDGFRETEKICQIVCRN